MFHHDPIDVLKKRSKIIVATGLLFAIAAALVSFAFPLQYRADAQVFIISQSRFGVDPYTVVRSAERIGENITQIMKTNDFYQKVTTQSTFGLDTSYFEGVPEREKRERWNKTIESSVVFGTGVLNISAYHENPEQAKAYAAASVQALVDRGWEYIGKEVTIKIINAPVVTKWPARPNIIVNTLLGFMLGIFVMSVNVLRKKRIFS